jgi:hypothetical protein
MPVTEPATAERKVDATPPQAEAIADILDTAEETPAGTDRPADNGKYTSWRGGMRRLDEAVSPLLKLLLLVSLVFGVYQYLQLREGERVNQALHYVSLWETEGYRDDLAAVNAALLPSFQDSRVEIDAAAGNDELVDKMLANLGDRLTGADDTFGTELEARIERIFYFFDRAAVCADNAICEYRVLRSFFADEASDFWGYFSTYARRKRDAGYSGYGDWTERFAKGAISNPRFWVVI